MHLYAKVKVIQCGGIRLRQDMSMWLEVQQTSSQAHLN